MVWLLIAAFCVVKTTLNIKEMLQVIFKFQFKYLVL